MPNNLIVNDGECITTLSGDLLKSVPVGMMNDDILQSDIVEFFSLSYFWLSVALCVLSSVFLA